MLPNKGPIYIALCGWPKTGKSEVQRILQDRYQAVAVDDAHPLRDFAIRHLGASIEDVTTQEGKRKVVNLPGGKTMDWRSLLGEFGNRIEDLLGADAIPEMAILRSRDASKIYSFGSVRRDQGFVYLRHGGMVVEIVNKFIPPSPYEFDRYNKAAITHVIENHVQPESRNGDTLAALEARTIELFDRILGPDLRAKDAA